MRLLDLDRREFLQSTLVAGAASAFPSLASSQSRAEVLLLVQELGPNSLDMHGVGSNQTVNGLAWNCYDRLISHEMKSGPGGVPAGPAESRGTVAGTGRPAWATRWRESAGAACRVPNTNRITGPWLGATRGPVKYRPGTDNSYPFPTSGVPPTGMGALSSDQLHPTRLTRAS